MNADQLVFDVEVDIYAVSVRDKSSYHFLDTKVDATDIEFYPTSDLPDMLGKSKRVINYAIKKGYLKKDGDHVSSKSVTNYLLSNKHRTSTPWTYTEIARLLDGEQVRTEHADRAKLYSIKQNKRKCDRLTDKQLSVLAKSRKSQAEIASTLNLSLKRVSQHFDYMRRLGKFVKSNKRRWTNEEIGILTTLYNNDVVVDKMAEVLDRPVKAVYLALIKKGIAGSERQGGLSYIKAEDEFINSNKNTMSIRQMSRKLNRSESGVIRRILGDM